MQIVSHSWFSHALSEDLNLGQKGTRTRKGNQTGHTHRKFDMKRVKAGKNTYGFL